MSERKVLGVTETICGKKVCEFAGQPILCTLSYGHEGFCEHYSGKAEEPARHHPKDCWCGGVGGMIGGDGCAVNAHPCPGLLVEVAEPAGSPTPERDLGPAREKKNDHRYSIPNERVKDGSPSPQPDLEAAEKWLRARWGDSWNEVSPGVREQTIDELAAYAGERVGELEAQLAERKVDRQRDSTYIAELEREREELRNALTKYGCVMHGYTYMDDTGEIQRMLFPTDPSKHDEAAKMELFLFVSEIPAMEYFALIGTGEEGTK